MVGMFVQVMNIHSSADGVDFWGVGQRSAYRDLQEVRLSPKGESSRPPRVTRGALSCCTSTANRGANRCESCGERRSPTWCRAPRGARPTAAAAIAAAIVAADPHAADAGG